MLKIHGPNFCHAIMALARVQLITENQKAANVPDEAIHPDLVKSCEALLTDFATNVGNLGAIVTQRAAQDLMMRLPRLKYLSLGQEYAYLEKTLRFELEKSALFALAAARASYWTQEEPLFGAAVNERFPHAIDDIVSAGKCLATDQGTAVVFHLMRVMEEGLKALAKEMSIPYAPSWESYIKQITKKMEEPYSKRPPKWRKHGTFYRDVLGDLQAVKFAWRNPTMHIVKKYNPDEAEDIYRCVRSFMQRLAAGLPAPKSKRSVK